MKILVAEDSVTMRKVLEMTFAGENAQVTTVDSCERAVEVARELNPDVVLADLSMSGLDGYGVAEALNGIPVVVMASQQQPYDEARGASAGVANHITKPFDTQVLIDMATSLAGSASQETGRPGPVVTMSSIPADGFSSIPADGYASIPVSQHAPPPLPPLPSAAPLNAPSEPASMKSETPSSSMSSRAPSVASPAGGSMRVDPSMVSRLAELGLTEAQVEGVLRLSTEAVERVVWEVVPELAETLIREEIRRLTGQ